MRGTGASTDRIPFRGHCERCARTVRQAFPAAKVNEGNPEKRCFCSECGHPTLCEMVEP